MVNIITADSQQLLESCPNPLCNDVTIVEFNGILTCPRCFQTFKEPEYNEETAAGDVTNFLPQIDRNQEDPASIIASLTPIDPLKKEPPYTADNEGMLKKSGVNVLSTKEVLPAPRGHEKQQVKQQQEGSRAGDIALGVTKSRRNSKYSSIRAGFNLSSSRRN